MTSVSVSCFTLSNESFANNIVSVVYLPKICEDYAKPKGNEE